MPNHSSIYFLVIKDPCVEFHHLKEHPHGFYLELTTTKRRSVKCLICQEKTNKLHAYRWQKISFQMVQIKLVIFHFKKRRYQCRAYGIVCAFMAWTVLVGVVVTALLGWWWADSIVALALVKKEWGAIQEVRRKKF